MTLGACFTLVVAAAVLLPAALHAMVLVRANRRPPAHPPERACTARPVLGGAELARLVATETIATLWLAVASLRPGGGPFGDVAAARWGMLLIGPAWLPRRALAVLARRLARPGVVVGLARLPCRPTPGAFARIANMVARDAAHDPTPLVLVCYDRAGGAAVRLAELWPRQTLRRCVLLGAPAAAVAEEDPRTIAIRVAGDAWFPEDEAGRRPTGGIELAGIGHLGLLVAPHVADVVYDAAVDADPAPPGIP